MNVRLPLNIEDEDIGLSDTGLPPSTPTAMSYTLCRIRLAEISRQIADETTDQHFQGKDLPYDTIFALDGKLRQGLNELPEFYRFSLTAQQERATLYRGRPVFASQRSMLQLGYHFRLCRLHRQHFVRGAKDPRYSYSHVVCLQSARTVLEIKRIMDEDSPIMEPSSSLIWAVMHHVFVAAVILLIDVCYNWEDVLAVKRKEEVIAACRMLTHAHRSSAVARRAVDAMMDVLRKHWIHVRGLKCPQAQARAQMQAQLAKPTEALQQGFVIDTPDSIWYAPQQSQRQEGSQPQQVDMPLEDLWKEMLDGSAQAGLDTPDWTDLLNDLTNANYPGEL
jgi:hypothetical protein